MATAEPRNQLSCSICLILYTDPVSLPCGHNFCQVCIEKVLDTQEGSGAHPCSECREEYEEYPDLPSNITLGNITERLLSTEPQQDRTEFHSLAPAAKSCLICEASLCDALVRGHSKSTEHVLTEPSTSLGNRKCSAHNELLKYYCCEESVCVCESCCLAGEHRGHRVELLSEASEKKKEKLRKVLEKLTLEKQEAELGFQDLWRDEQEKTDFQTEQSTNHIRNIKEQLNAIEPQVLTEISKKKEEISLQLSDLMEQLEMKKDELSRKIRHIEELCNMADPLTVLQERESHGAADNEGADNEGADNEGKDNRHVTALNVSKVDLISETLVTIIAKIVTGDQEWWLYGQEATDLLLDINTAGNHVSVSEDRKSASYSLTALCYPQTPERFIAPQALSIRSFYSGQHYWDVKVSKSGWWGIGVAYPSVERGSEMSSYGDNNKSWCLCSWRRKYLAMHDKTVTYIPASHYCRRIRILLDYEAGRLSFYELSEPIRHLHTFSATFTEPLHAAFMLWWVDSWVKIVC